MVFIGGDLNNRIGTQNDFIIEHGKDLNFLSQGYELDTIRSVRSNSLHMIFSKLRYHTGI